MKLDIVSFEQAHLEPVVRLSLRAWEPVFDSLENALEPAVFSAFYPDWKVAQREAVVEACTSLDHETWVALIGEDIAGFVDVVRRDPVLGEIHMVAVDPAHQHQGIGARLTEFAVDRLRESGAAVAMVETGGDPGHEPARRTYVEAGFRLFPVARYFRRL